HDWPASLAARTGSPFTPPPLCSSSALIGSRATLVEVGPSWFYSCMRQRPLWFLAVAAVAACDGGSTSGGSDAAAPIGDAANDAGPASPNQIFSETCIPTH